MDDIRDTRSEVDDDEDAFVVQREDFVDSHRQGEGWNAFGPYMLEDKAGLEAAAPCPPRNDIVSGARPVAQCELRRCHICGRAGYLVATFSKSGIRGFSSHSRRNPILRR